MNIAISQVITQIFAFLIMLFVLKRFAWKPLLDILEERKKRIQAEFNSIEVQKQQTARLNNEYQNKLEQIEAEARSKIQEGIKEGREIAAEIQKETQNKAKEILKHAELQTERELVKAKKQLQQDIVTMAISISEKMISHEIDQEKHHKLIEDFVEKTKF